MQRSIFRPRACVAVLTTAALLVVMGCQRAPSSPVVARVGDAVLTLGDLQQGAPAEYRDAITREQHINYVKQWIDQELLFQGAVARGIDREDAVRRRLNRMRRDLLCAEMLNRRDASLQDLQISEDAVQAYYEKNKASFTRKSDVIRHIEMTLPDLRTAWKVREMVTPDNFQALAATYSKLPVPDPRSVPFTPLSSLPAPLATTIPQIRIGGTSEPIRTADGYALVRVLDKQSAGTPCSLDEVREEIVNMLSAQLQRNETDRLLSDLRQKTTVEYHFDLIPQTAPAAVGGGASSADSGRGE